MGLCVSCRQSKAHFGNCKRVVDFLPSKPDTETYNGFAALCDEKKSTDCLNKHSDIMAASFSNLNLTNPIKVIVSKKRNRYKQDGFNLDLTYITNSIIAMGYPASNIESVYRNNIEDVVKFLDQKHPNHYMIYNLCSERSYDKSKFHNRVIEFPFDDHSPPKIESIKPFCQNVDQWLLKDPENVAVVHCKAGKGRTGTMICCYLLHSGVCSTADQALTFYGGKRTQDTKGVTIPSQVRYVRYYEQLVYRHLHYAPITLYIKELIFDPVPTFMGGPGSLSFTVYESFTCDKLSQKYKSEVYKISTDSKPYTIKLDTCFRLTGDVKIEFYNKVMMRKEKLFHFWFNTFFVGVLTSSDLIVVYNQPQNCTDTDSGEQNYKLVFSKNELDKLNKKDKQHKIFNENFKLTIILQKVPKGSDLTSKLCQQDTTPSESSIGSSEDSDDDWDSGEHNPKLPLVGSTDNKSSYNLFGLLNH